MKSEDKLKIAWENTDAVSRLLLAIPLMVCLLLFAFCNDAYWHLRHWILGEPLPPAERYIF